MIKGAHTKTIKVGYRKNSRSIESSALLCTGLLCLMSKHSIIPNLSSVLSAVKIQKSSSNEK